ncbi:MAG TPA: NB-ARC domain-containing protein, partial [Anaerolineales bacterium]|nr:NB-ARC domain-containing protein [Anaerolineales bacterium]
MSVEIYSLGEWIRRRRKALDLTQQGLADLVPCSVNTIKKLETDARRPSRELASLLASKLEISKDKQELFVDIARGVRSLDMLEQLTSPTDVDLQIADARLEPDLQSASVFSIIGRDLELSALTDLLKESRIVTITGPGGVGKSTLAQAILADHQKHGKRGFFVPLVGVSAVEHLPSTLASTLGLDVPFQSDPLEQIISYLTNKDLLLVLDNFEHLLDGASVVGQVVQSAAGVKVLVTSRERLRVTDEQAYPLQGLRYPEEHDFAGEISTYPALELFVDRASKINPVFSFEDKKTLAQICQLTEGTPLALEMLASWADVLPLKDIIPELTRNIDVLANADPRADARHRSMRAVFDSSWQMLGKQERNVFSRLCVFQGGFTRQAAEVVGGASLINLSTLAGRSLIKMDYESGRYSVHSLLQLFGEEQLTDASLIEDVRKDHAECFFSLAKTAGAHLHTADQEDWFEQLDLERENIRAALDALLSSQDEKGGRMIVMMSWYWRIRSKVVEARQWLAQALNIKQLSKETRANLHYHAGHFGWMQNEVEFARSYQLKSLELWEALGESGINGKAYSHQSLGMIAELIDHHEKALEEYQTSIELFKASGDFWGVAFARHRLGNVFFMMERFDEAH